MPPKFKNWLAVLFILSGASIAAQTGTFILRDTFCSNQLIIVGNQVFDASMPSGTVVLSGAASNGGDSTVIVALVFRQPVTVTLDQTLCEGDTLWVNGTPYHAGYYIGQEVVQEGASNGCDSIINVHLTFRKINHDYTADICEGDTIFINGHEYDALHNEGTEVIPNGVCDSIVHVKLNPLTPPFSYVRDTLCPDDVMLINGTRYDANNRAGYEILKGAASTGCDSIVVVQLEFRNLWVYIGEDQEIVKGDTVCIIPQYGLTPTSLQWLPTAPCADSACLDHCIRLIDPSTFTLIATDVSGCVLKDEIHISISDKNRVYAPNVFAPDAAWPDNYFFLNCDYAVVRIKRLVIADRWGEVLFDKSGLTPGKPEDGWDGSYKGQIMSPDTFIFYALLERFDGSTFESKGGFSLIR